MKLKLILLLALMGVAGTASLNLNAKTYVPSSKELATVVGGAWCDKMFCKPAMRCVSGLPNVACTDHNSLCSENEDVYTGMPCQSADFWFPREACFAEIKAPYHKCTTDEGDDILCHGWLPQCRCNKDPMGFWECGSGTGQGYTYVKPCSQQEM